MSSPAFHCKRFVINQEGAAHPVGTDSFLLGSWASIEGVTRALDIGCGTGILSLMLAQRLEAVANQIAQIEAVELHAGSAACALRNLRASPWLDQVRVYELPIQQFKAEAAFDLIISNPPFFLEKTIAPDPDRRHARAAVTLTQTELIQAVLRHLHPKGRFCLILPVNEGRLFYQTAATMGLYLSKKVTVYPRPGKPAERLLLELTRSAGRYQQSELYIYQEGTQYSEDYQRLVADFYKDF